MMDSFALPPPPAPSSSSSSMDNVHGNQNPLLSSLLSGVLFVDDQNNDSIRLLDPKVLEKSVQLQNLINIFLEKNGDFKNTVTNFVLTLDQMSDQVEQHKIKAIGSRSLIKALQMEKDSLKEQYRNLIREKKLELERMQLEHELLKREELEHKNLLQMFQQLKR